MVLINELPVELLLQVFSEGCKEELTDTDPLHSHPRRCKKFATPLREVCSSWRNLIDLPHFWIARLRLRLVTQKSEGTPAREVVQFYRQLCDSRGCDLFISFTSSSPECIFGHTIPFDVELLSPRSSIGIRLFIHGMRFLRRYQKQIVALQIFTSQPQIDGCLLDLLQSMKEASNLMNLDICNLGWSTENEGQVDLKVIQERWSMSQFHSPWRECRETRDNHISFTHFRNLRSLFIGDSAWFDDLKLPPSLSQLILYDNKDCYPFLKALTTNTLLRCNLTWLWVTPSPGICDGDLIDSKRRTLEAGIELPKLTFLGFGGSCLIVQNLLTNLSFPRLRNAKMVMSLQRIDSSKFSDLKKLIIAPRLQYLRCIHFKLNSSWCSLFILDYFKESGVESLNIYTTYQEGTLGEEFDRRFTSSISQYCPKWLKIGAKSMDELECILKRAALTEVKDLIISLRTVDSQVLSPATNSLRQSNANMNLEVLNAPQLIKLSITGMELYHNQMLLSYFRTDALQELSIEFPAFCSRPRIDSKYIARNLLSVRTFQCRFVPTTVSSDFLRSLWDMVPNVEEVTVDIGSNWSQSDPSNRFAQAELSAITASDETINAFTESLKPTPQGHPLPKLWRLDLSLLVDESIMAYSRKSFMELLESRSAEIDGLTMESLEPIVTEWTGKERLKSNYKLVKYQARSILH